MKNFKKEKNNKIDIMEKIRKDKNFDKYFEDAMVRNRLAVEVYNNREAQHLSQQQLAKNINSTQKVISKIENGDVNMGIELLGRIAKSLDFTSDNLARIFNRPFLISFLGTESRKVDINL